MADTRKDKRAPVSLKVRFKSATVDEFIEQYSRDISRGGIFIKSKTPMSVGTLLKFEFQLKDESRLIHGVGRVVWKRDESETANGSPPGMGIKFIKMDPESRTLVEKIVSTRGHDAGAFEEGQGESDEGHEAPSGGGTPFFPTTTSEAEMPRPEDRTQIRDASEFLASALAGAGEDAAAEAEAGAEHARRRTEEIQREREAAERARKEQEEREAEERATQAHVARPMSSEPPTALYQMSPLAAQSRRSTPPPAENGASVPQGVWGGASSSSSSTPVPAAEPARASASASDQAVISNAREAVKSARSAPLRLDETHSGRPPGTRPATSPASRVVPMLMALAAVGIGVYLVVRYTSAANDKPEGLDDGVAAETIEPLDPPAAAEPSPSAAANPSQPAPTDENVPMVAVRVESTPSGALVRVNGEQRGTTPADVQLPIGREVTLVVKAPGHAAQTQQITPQQGQQPIQLTLPSLPYVLEVESTPTGARVTAGGRNVVAPAEIQLREVRGPVPVVATLPGHQRVNVSVEPESFAERDGTMRHHLALTLPQRVRPPPTKAGPAGEPGAERPAGEATTPSAEGAPPATPGPEQPAPTPAPGPTPAAPAPEAPAPSAPAPLPDNPFN